MNSLNNIKNWHIYFSNLGSRVSPRVNKRVWMDLEYFVVLGCKIASTDDRLLTSFTILCTKLAPILSPFKIKKIAKEISDKNDYNLLGYIITKVQQNVRNKTQWSSLLGEWQSRANLKDNIRLFNTSAFKHDLDLKKWGLLASSLELQAEDKYLNLKKLYSFPIVKMRFSGVKVVYSDINYYQAINGSHISIKQMAKDIFQDYNSVYQAHEHLLLAA